MKGVRLRCGGMTHTKHEPAETRTTTLSVAGMSCGACARHVTRALEGMTDVVHVDVDLQTNEARVEHLPASVDAVALIAAVRDAGYHARLTRTTADDHRHPTERQPVTARGCGCCGTSPTGRAWWDLGTSTIG